MNYVFLSVHPSLKDDQLIQVPVDQRSVSSIQDDTEKAEKTYAALKARCSQILPLLTTPAFNSKYWTLPINLPDCYVFSHLSERTLILEVVTRFNESQIENLHTYKFVAHPEFEEKVNSYTRFTGATKPNPHLLRSRSWDVALNVVMKIEALSSPYDRFLYLLKREYRILNYLWVQYLNSPMDIDEMTGIPMVFEFNEVPNHEYYATAEGAQSDEIDMGGKMKPLRFPLGSQKRSTLTYFTMEKLGPNIGYLQKLVRTAHKLHTFDLWTAMKIFDQLLCRIMQVHRLGVVHNDICPENIYMGNGVAFDVVYLNNYKRAYIVLDVDKEGPSGLSVSCVGCNFRFASIGQLSGSPRLMCPIDDVESAFYLLIAMLNADVLPWDCLLRPKKNPEAEGFCTNPSMKKPDRNDSNAYDDMKQMHVAPAYLSNELIRKVCEFKQRFWSSNQVLNMVLSSLACIFNVDEAQSIGVLTAIREIYYRVKEWRNSFNGADDSFLYCKKLGRATSEEYRNFCELRKCALIYFKFADTFDLLNDIAFRNKVDNQMGEMSEKVQQPWNYLVWCFNNIEIKHEPKPFPCISTLTIANSFPSEGDFDTSDGLDR